MTKDLKNLLIALVAVIMVIVLASAITVVAQCVIPATGVNVFTTDQSPLAADTGKTFIGNLSAAHTLTLPSPPPTNVWMIWIGNYPASTANVTVSRNGLTINGLAANKTVAPGETIKCTTDGTNYFCGGNALHSIGYAFGDAATGATLTTSETGYVTVPFACTITGWHISVDAGTATMTTWRVNGGTALPTVSNTISTSGVAISSGTKVDSTTVSDFTSTAIAPGDTLGFHINAVGTAKQLTFQVDCGQ